MLQEEAAVGRGGRLGRGAAAAARGEGREEKEIREEER
jgi:hypothetical protein